MSATFIAGCHLEKPTVEHRDPADRPGPPAESGESNLECPTLEPSATGSVFIRWSALSILLLAELLLLTLRFDSATVAGHAGWWTRLVERAHIVPQLLIVMATATLVFGAGQLQSWAIELTRLPGIRRPCWPWCLAHLALFIVFVPLTAIVFEGGLNPIAAQQILPIAWFILGLAIALSWCLAMLSPESWLALLTRHYILLFGGMAIGVAAWTAGQLSDRLWHPLGQSTLWLVAGLLRLVTSEVIIRPEDFILGTPTFVVRIAPSCSGYEGIGLVCIFVGTFLWWCRQDLRWPQAWLLLPLATALMWLFNGFRIAGLIMVGSSGWRDIALGGFHSQAGWLAFNAVALGLVAFSRNSRLFSVTARVDHATRDEPPTAAYLVPLIILVTTIMVTGAAISGFDFLYPLRIVTVTVSLLCYARYYARWDWSWSWYAVAMGAVTFALWIALEWLTAPALESSDLPSGLANLSPFLAAAWIVCRIIGSVIIAPLAEELAFRGYLMRRLVAADFETVPATRSSWTALLISSALFGALHPGRWIAGTMAGALFGLAYYRRGNVVDAVLAHATTDALIAFYVLSTGSWTLWS